MADSERRHPFLDDSFHVPSTFATNRKRVLVLGPRRSGKTSIQRVVFHKMPPHETLYIETTTELQCYPVTNMLVDFEIWDFPGGYEFNDLDQPPQDVFPTSEALVCVVDAQMRSYPEQLQYCERMIVEAYGHNPDLKFHVFIHKVESEQFEEEQAKFQLYKDINDGLQKSLEQALGHRIPVTCHTTSIYDQSIFEAFSKVVQSLLMPQVKTFLNQMLDMLVTNCDMEKAYIFDIISKIYLATDSNPSDSDAFGLCSDVIDTVIAFAEIYGAQDSHTMGFDEDCASIISLNSDHVLITRQLARDLALVCFMQKELSQTGTIKYNFEVFREGLSKMVKVVETHGDDS